MRDQNDKSALGAHFTLRQSQIFKLPLHRYDNRKNTGNEGPCGCPKEVSLTLKTKDIKLLRKSNFL